MKYILVFLLGFVTHKGLEEIYDYSFMKGFSSETCTQQYILDSNDPKIDAPLTKRFQCTYNEMGPVAYLSYVLARPHFSDFTGNRWYY